MMVLQDTSLLADHWHCALLDSTCTVRCSPAGVTVSRVDERRKPHGLPACEICSSWPFTLTLLVRDGGSAFAATENRTDPSPCPLGSGCSASHGASDWTTHAQSRVTLIWITPPPPLAGNDIVSVCIWTLQRACVGATNVVEDPELHAIAAMADAIAQNSPMIGLDRFAFRMALPEWSQSGGILTEPVGTAARR
jgi:hypothetical protein